jgi:hypothetical protein
VFIFQFSEELYEENEDELQIDPYQEITFNAGFGMKTTLQSVVDAGLMNPEEVDFHYV